MSEYSEIIADISFQQPDTWLSALLAMFALLWPYLIAAISLALSLTVTLHVVLNKRDARAAAAWTGLVWLVPLLGSLLYWILGVNRIRRRARQLTGGMIDAAEQLRQAGLNTAEVGHLRGLNETVGRLTQLPLVSGNAVTPLPADMAFSQMVEAIEGATDSVYLTTYIFDNSPLCWPLVMAMSRAKQRGVKVRVLLDGMGVLYSFPTVLRRLRQSQVPYDRFLHSLAPWRMPYMNLRNHRKILVIDRRIGFTGGMNIRHHYLAEPPTALDLHARVEGPVVEQLMRSFATDWHFTCGEILNCAYTGADKVGSVVARGISAGPDADFDKRRLALLSAIGAAKHHIRILTPYFVPDKSILVALQLALLRGVSVDIVVPRKSNLRFVHWASLHALQWLVYEGVRLHLSPPPFDHSKIMTVDGLWSMVGSGNWDARSLRLNFEFDLECYDNELAEQLNGVIDRQIANSTVMNSDNFATLSVGAKIRNALAHLFEPYL